MDVTSIDWGDNIESVDAFVRRPFRLEVVLFETTLDGADDRVHHGHAG